MLESGLNGKHRLEVADSTLVLYSFQSDYPACPCLKQSGISLILFLIE
jgi:hypothetical protein